MGKIREQSEAIALSTKNVGIDPITVITILTTVLPALIKCWQGFNPPSSNPAADAAALQQYAEDHYDTSSATFDQIIIDRMRPQTRRAARQHEAGRLCRYQLDVISTAALQKARTSGLPDVAACMAEAAAVPDLNESTN